MQIYLEIPRFTSYCLHIRCYFLCGCCGSQLHACNSSHLECVCGWIHICVACTL